MNVLLTKRPSPSDLDLIRSWGWNFEVIETLKVTPLEVNAIPTGEVWVVSSRNSWSVVKKFVDRAPGAIYCVGHIIREELIKVGVKSAIRNFENMKMLVADLAEQKFQSILYFCGDEHRKELEDGLKQTPVKISKIVTHQSQMTFPVIKNGFDAVFVFSPRSAESLLKGNAFGNQTVFVCIGPTTESYVKDRGISNTFVASYPDSRILLTEFHQSRQATASGPATSPF